MINYNIPYPEQERERERDGDRDYMVVPMCSSLAQGKRYWTAGRQTSTFSIRTAVSLFVHVASTL